MNIFFSTIFALIVLGLSERTALMAATPLPLTAWTGEYFVEKQGAIYLKAELSQFKASQQTKFITGNLQIVVYNILTKNSYSLSHTLMDVSRAPKEIWKIPSGKYMVRSVDMVDANGAIRRWRPKIAADGRTFIVKRQAISNLGLWALIPLRDTGLNIKFTMTPNSYTESGDKKDSSVIKVIDGYNGESQQVLGGETVGAGAKGNYSTGKSLRAVTTVTRQISMFYKLNLFNHNYYARAASDILTLSDAQIRQCYIDRMNALDKDINGDIVFTFIIAHQNGTITKIKKSSGTIDDLALTHCLELRLQSIQFSPDATMIGELTYTFNVQ